MIIQVPGPDVALQPGATYMYVVERANCFGDEKFLEITRLPRNGGWNMSKLRSVADACNIMNGDPFIVVMDYMKKYNKYVAGADKLSTTTLLDRKSREDVSIPHVFWSRSHCEVLSFSNWR